MINKSIGFNGLLNSFKTVLSLLFPLITFPYVSRILGPDGIGKVAYSQSIITYFILISSLGIPTYGIRECAKVRDNKVELSTVVKEIFIINIISTIISYVLFGLVLLSCFKETEYIKLLIICSSTILFSTLGMDWLYSAMEDYKYITIRSILFQTISILLLFAFVKTKDDYLNYAAISVFANVGSNICNFIHSKKYISFINTLKLNFAKHIKSIFTLFAMNIAISVFTVLDTTMLGLMTDSFQVGYYNAATKINRIIIRVIGSISAVLLPRLSYYIEQNNYSVFEKLLNNAMKFIILISIPCCFGLCVFSKNIVIIFSGEKYLPSVLPMQILNPLILIVSLSGIIGMQVFMPLRKEKYTLISEIVGAIVNFSLNIVFIKKIGVIGAAIASLIAETCVCIVQYCLSRKIIKWEGMKLHFFQCTISSCIFTILILFINKIIESVYIELLIGFVVSFICYFTVLYFLKNKYILNYINKGRSRL